MKASLLEIAEAIQQSEGRTPAEIIGAFLPDTKTVIGQKLVPLKLGHELFLAKIEHPLSSGSDEWAPNDIASALFVFTRPSRELFEMLENDTYLDSFYKFLDEVDATEIDAASAELLHHWYTRKQTALAMESPHPSSQKKTAGSAGG